MRTNALLSRDSEFSLKRRAEVCFAHLPSSSLSTVLPLPYTILMEPVKVLFFCVVARLTRYVEKSVTFCCSKFLLATDGLSEDHALSRKALYQMLVSGADAVQDVSSLVDAGRLSFLDCILLFLN